MLNAITFFGTAPGSRPGSRGNGGASRGAGAAAAVGGVAAVTGTAHGDEQTAALPSPATSRSAEATTGPIEPSRQSKVATIPD